MKVSFAVFIKVPNQRITRLIREISGRYKVYVQAKDEIGPHITLAYSKDMMRYEDATKLIGHYRNTLMRIEPFDIEINGIRSFRKHFGKKIGYAIYVRVVPNRGIMGLHGTLCRDIKCHEFGVFKPHITIARRDVTRDKFCAILREHGKTRIRFTKRVSCVYAGIGTAKGHAYWELRRLYLRRGRAK